MLRLIIKENYFIIESIIKQVSPDVANGGDNKGGGGGRRRKESFFIIASVSEANIIYLI